MPVIYQFSYDSPVRYLPLAYMLPYDVISRYPTLSKLPRSMGALNAIPGWGKVILSQQFLNEIMDAVASLAFPHFGFGGWKEHYSGYSPMVYWVMFALRKILLRQYRFVGFIKLIRLRNQICRIAYAKDIPMYEVVRLAVESYLKELPESERLIYAGHCMKNTTTLNYQIRF